MKPEKEGTRIFELAGEEGRARRLGASFVEKDLIRVGTFVHPEKKFTVEVTPERMRRWASAFGRMKANGIDVPVPYGHSYDSRDNAGFLREMWVDGDRLVGLIEVPKEADRENLGTTVRRVSVSLNPSYVDGEGREYGEVIEHVAATNYPVVPGQDNFKPAMSGEGPLQVIRLDRLEEDVMDKENEDVKRPSNAEGGTDAELERLRREKLELERRLESETAAAAEAKKALESENTRLRLERVKAEVEGLVAKGKVVASDENKADIVALLSAEGTASLQLSVEGRGQAESPAAIFRRFLSRIPEGALVELGAKVAVSNSGPEDSAEREAKKNLDAAGIKTGE